MFNKLKKRIQRRLKYKAFKKQLRKAHPLERGMIRFKYMYPNQEMGFGTYGIPKIINWETVHRVEIGKYCSIAEDVKIMLGGGHFLDWGTMSPLWVFDKNIKPTFPTPKPEDANRIEKVTIGNDVWLATDCFILSTVTIGHGAVVAARSLVTKDVPPYAIVAGIPAKVIRYRFPEEIIKELLANPWWDLPYKEIVKISPLLCSDNITGLIDYLKNRSATNSTANQTP